MFVKGLDVVGQLLVFAAVTFVTLRELQQNSVKLLDVVLADRDVGPGIENRLRRFGVACDFLLVTGLERTQIEIGEKQINLNIR